MVLWVRSQDGKRLVECHDFSLQEKIQYTYAILGGTYGKHIMGTYKNKERAMQILDEIQNLLTPRFIVNETSDNDLIENLFDKSTANKAFYSNKLDIKQIENNYIVYQMPKE